MLPKTWPVPELPNISIDNFDSYVQDGIEVDNYLSTCFFLSHCHTDHMKGLGPTFFNFLKNNPGYYLYCSPCSKNILINDLKFRNAVESTDNDFIKELEGKMVITVPGRDDTKTVSYEVTVTALPVDHCLGSVMYLFETTRGVVLYTGDFRIIKGDTPKYKELQPYCDGFNKIDKLYFDATFFKKNYWEFPKISESLNQISEIIENWLDADPNNHVNLMKSARYGYEYVLIKLAEIFQCQIHVDEMLYRVYSEIPEIGSKLTTSPIETRIHSCLENDVVCNPSHLCTVKLFAQSFTSRIDSPRCKIVTGGGNNYNVCYATHCSYSEIIDFLHNLKPKSMEPLCRTFYGTEEDVRELIGEIRSSWI